MADWFLVCKKLAKYSKQFLLFSVPVLHHSPGHPFSVSAVFPSPGFVLMVSGVSGLIMHPGHLDAVCTVIGSQEMFEWI